MEAAPRTDAELREQAISQLKKKRDFRTHVFIYILVNAMLVVIWAVTGSGFFWPIFPILGWGVGIGANAWDVYARKPLSEDEIQREAQRLRG
jgi:2TM domain